MNCKFCNKNSKNSNYKKTHERFCKLNPSREIPHFQKLHNLNLLPPWNKGKKIGTSPHKGKHFPNRKTKMQEQTKKKLSIKMNKLIENGWRPIACGRCKKYNYNSPIAGSITLDGTWELKVAKWLDSKNYNWKRNTKRFLYVSLDNKTKGYVPDFWVEEFDGYLEVKGYETKLDRCKWSQFPEKLIIWKREEISKL